MFAGLELTQEMVDYIKSPGFRIEEKLENGHTVVWTYDAVNEKLVSTITAPEANRILLENAQIRQESNKSFKGDIHYIARIPKLALANHIKARGMSHSDFMSDANELRKLLNGEDGQPFRVKNGKV